jgi:hypothetical protein
MNMARSAVMASNHEEHTALRVMRKQIAAEDYNRIRLGLLRERRPLRVRIDRFRCLLCILDESEWWCIDECQDNQPVLAWRNFDTRERASLNASVECDLHLYHVQAGLLMGSVLEAMARAVDAHHRSRHEHGSPVADIRTPAGEDPPA